MKDDAVLYMKSLKARWDKIRFYVPRKLVGLRKNGKAGLSAIGTLQNLNPVVARHP